MNARDDWLAEAFDWGRKGIENGCRASSVVLQNACASASCCCEGLFSGRQLLRPRGICGVDSPNTQRHGSGFTMPYAEDILTVHVSFQQQRSPQMRLAAFRRVSSGIVRECVDRCAVRLREIHFSSSSPGYHFTSSTGARASVCSACVLACTCSTETQMPNVGTFKMRWEILANVT
jgi:hypothetical protein